jgi:uncharacterized protein (DUF983 family)
VGPVFEGLTAVRFRCRACGLDLRRHDVGDGPTLLALAVLAGLLAGAVIWVEVTHDPPLWLHLALWPALAFPLAFLLARPFKAALVGLLYLYNTGEIER